MDIDMAALHALRADIDDKLAQLREIRTGLRESTFTGRSADGTIVCSVDGDGTVTDLQIAKGALRTAHVSALEAQIEQAIRAARSAQGAASGERYQRLLPGVFEEVSDNGDFR
jgi:DNA-binding protein YbaB